MPKQRIPLATKAMLDEQSAQTVSGEALGIYQPERFGAAGDGVPSDVGERASGIDPEAQALAAFRAERGVPVLGQVTAS